jgi:hypothetical protein
MSVKFSYGDSAPTEIEIQNPARQNVLRTKKTQASGRSAAGVLYVYDQGVPLKEIELQFENLRESEKNELQSFYDDTVEGMFRKFTYTDHHGDAWTARFLQPELEFTEIADVVASSGTFVSGAVGGSGGTEYPTTTRGAGVWNARVILEVSAA